ncbi:MAG TPA: DUF72 domain-containing protein, partial [Puia sp.]|nr:DUF72 domain-containing protein [Puia sp.]
LLDNKKPDGMDFYFLSYMSEGKIYVGTSGWDYKHWRGVFYPRGITIAGELTYYSGLFNASEINNSFYRLPLPSTVKRWVAEVPAGFCFCPKMSRYITHAKKLNAPQQGLPRFFEVFDPFRRRLGPILIQLPSMLGFNREKASIFFEALKMYKGYRFALEPRHSSWMEEDAIRLLKKYHIGFVIAESGKRWPSGEFITASHIYLRFHGPNGYYDTAYPGQRLAAIAKKCRDWASEGHTIWAFFNNDGHAYAVKNAMTFKRLLAKSPADADRWYS